MITPEAIARGGGKLEVTRALIEADLGLPIPRSAWRYAHEPLSVLREEFRAMRKPVIVRGSHPNDYEGFVDVVPTVKGVDSWSGLERAVATIEKKMRGEDVRIHAADWGQSYSPETHILVQEQSPSPIAGTMLRHPHTGDFYIQYADMEEWLSGEPFRSPFSFMFIGHDFSSELSWLGLPAEEVAEAAHLYAAVENAGVIDPRTTLKVEFGLSPLRFYQANPAMTKRPAEDFELPDVYDSQAPFLFPGVVFGITPPDGVELEFKTLDLGCFPQTGGISLPPQSPYGLFTVGKSQRSLRNEVRFGNLHAFVSSCTEVDFLAHAQYRLLKKAHIGFVEPIVRGNDGGRLPSVDSLNEFRESRVFSNGRHGLIVPTKYL